MSTISRIANAKKYYDGVMLLERMAELHTPAVSIAVIENYEISETCVYGVKKKTSKEAITPNTLFQAGSISKAVFAVGVIRLTEQGILDIDVDISKYLADLEIPTYDNQKHKITLRQILSHQAGFNLHGFAGYQQGQEIPTVEQILTGASPANNLKLKLIKTPETGYQYSGGGYILAQKIVSDVCKQELPDLMEEIVLSPLSMTNSTFAQPLPKELLSEIAVGYSIHDLELPGGYNIMPELSAAGLWTTPSDLARLGIEIMKALKGESVFIKKETAGLMTTKVYENSPYGVGFEVNQCKKGSTFGHGGSNFGYHSNMIFCPQDGSGIVVMQNSDIGMGISKEITNAFKEVCGW